MSRRRALRLVLTVVVVLLAAVPIAMAAAPAEPAPGQRVDLKVLLLGDQASDLDTWKAELTREGVPFDAMAAPTITDSTLADYSSNHAKYEAVILATGDPASLSTDELAALAKYEKTFGIRQISDYTSQTAKHGLNAPTEGAQDGKVGTLTATGKLVFPYLKGDVPIDTGAYGYPATPANTTDFQTLLTAPDNASAYLGIYTHPDDGRQEMVKTVASNQFQSHDQLLRHGMLNWVTRGVFLGYQRNYLEMQVDDVFLPDDSWDPATHTTNYDPAAAIRMTPDDVTKAVNWSNANKLRLDFVYNGGGSTGANDALLTALKANKASFGWINHTYDHPNLDCSTQSFISKEITDNVTWAQTNGFPISAGELVTGEHSGLANTRPGNPGTIDPPSLDSVQETGTTGTLAAGTYDYAVTATTTHGETVPESEPATVAAGETVNLKWGAVCHATGYKVYRKLSTGTSWSLLTTVGQPDPAFTDAGPAPITYTDTGTAGTPVSPPASNTAALDPYAQNAAFEGALTAGHITSLAGDASKAYPNPPTGPVTGPTYPAGATFIDGPARVVPRYPTNVYYNTATQGQQLDEYNWLYNASKGCVPIPDVTTCNTGDVTWQQYLDNEAKIMFGHLMGNDPRPHYFHQTNLAETNQADGGVFYPVIDNLLARYNQYFTPDLVQLTQSQIGDELARQDAWQQQQSQVTGYIQDGQVHLHANAAAELPITGTTVGSVYGGQRSGWTKLAAGQDVTLNLSDPAIAAAPAITGSAVVGKTLTATAGTWSGTAPISHTYQWQRCNAAGQCTSIAGATATTYKPVAGDIGSRLRVVVSAGNWISSWSQASSAQTAAVTTAPVAPANTALPGITGTPRQGQTLTATTGKWTGTPPIGYAFQWQRCNAAGAGCASISGATRATYTALAGDVGHRLRAAVTASNAGGTKSATSNPTAVVAAPPAPPAHTTTTPPPSTTPPAATPAPAPLVLSKLKIAPRRFWVTRSAGHRSRPRSAKLSWKLNRGARVKLTVQLVLRGRRVGKACRPARGRISRRAACLRYRTIATLVRSPRAGKGSMRLTGRLHGRKLVAGAYRVRASATDKSGRRSAVRAVTFTVSAT